MSFSFGGTFGGFLGQAADLTLLDAIIGPFVDPLSRTWWPGLMLTGLVAGLVWWRRRPPNWSWQAVREALVHPSSRLDVQLLLARQLTQALFGAAGVGLAYALATRGVLAADRMWGRPTVPDLPEALISTLYTVTLFVAWDASRFLLHWLMHRFAPLWAFHQVHHSATVLTPLTFHRIHPVESALYRLRGGLVTGVVAGAFYWLFRDAATTWTWLGVPALGVVLNLTLGNLRHSPVWVRLPAWVEGWLLLSPAQHQLHHSVEEAHYDTNLGTWLPIWDRLAGTLLVTDTPPDAFGIPAANRNHDDHLLSAWLGPFTALRGPAAAALMLLAAWPAHAEESDDDEDASGEFGTEIIVTANEGSLRVAGAAQKIDEEQLEQFEYDDIERVLAQVPGVSTRGEDGYGLRPNIGIRGVNSDRSAKVTLMEDGVPLAPAPYAAPAAYYFPMSTRLTGVEVFKGAAATRHGPQTVAGAINLLTRPVPESTEWEVDLAGGLRQTARLHAFAGSGDETAGWLVEGAHLRTAGFKELDTGGPTGFNRSELMAKGRWAPAADHQLGLKLGFANEASHETYLGLSRSDYEANPYRRYAATAEALMTWNRTQAELSWVALPSERWSVRTVAYHHYLTRAWTKFARFGGTVDGHALMQEDPTTGQGAVYLDILRGLEDTTTPEQAIHIGTNDRRFHAYGVQTYARFVDNTGTVRHTVDMGVRLHLDDMVRVHTEDPYDMQNGQLVRNDTATLTTLDSVAWARALSAHVHEDLRWKVLHLLPGARIEVVRTQRSDQGEPTDAPLTRTVVLPGAGAMVDVTSSWSVFGGAYRGFSPVPPGEPEEVQPELSWNQEAGTRVAFGDLYAELVGFLNEYDNLTGQCTISGGCGGDALDQQFSGGSARVHGVEAALRHVVLLAGAFTMPLQGSYTFTRGQFRTAFVSDFPQFGEVDEGDYLPYVAEQQGYGRATVAHPRFDVGVGVTWRSEMLDQAGQWPAGEDDVPSLLLVDAGVRAFVTDRVTTYVTGTNLTQSTDLTSWRPIGARPTAPMQVMLGVEVRSPTP